eukprot:UN02764
MGVSLIGFYYSYCLVQGLEYQYLFIHIMIQRRKRKCCFSCSFTSNFEYTTGAGDSNGIILSLNNGDKRAFFSLLYLVVWVVEHEDHLHSQFPHFVSTIFFEIILRSCLLNQSCFFVPSLTVLVSLL